MSKKQGIVDVIVIVVVFILIAVGVTIAVVKKSKTANPTADTNNSTATSKAADSQLVGTWETTCLTPDPKSPWSEQHTFVIKADGTAVHTRINSETSAGCAPVAGTITDNFAYTIPTTGQINFTGGEANFPFFDIYKIDGVDLTFGHGFRLSYAGATKINGDTDANRIDTLNTYLVYKKK